MVSAIGFKLNSPDMITGFGYRRHRIHRARGDGVGRSAVAGVVKYVGHALTDRLASAIRGNGSYRLTGGRFRKGINIPSSVHALFKSGKPYKEHPEYVSWRATLPPLPPRKYKRLTAAEKQANRLKREANKLKRKARDIRKLTKFAATIPLPPASEEGLGYHRRRRARRHLTGGRRLVHRYF